MNALQRTLQSHFPPDMDKMCMISVESLDLEITRTRSACEASSVRAIQQFFDRNPVVADYGLPKELRFHQRAILFATEILGDDRGLTPSQMAEKSAIHLLLSVQMMLLWIVDDTIDVNARMDGDTTRRIVDYYVALLEPGGKRAEDAAALQAACSENGIPSTFVEVVTRLADWLRTAALATRISLDRSSVYGELNEEVLRSLVHVHDAFDSIEQYFQYRASNCALCLNILCGAYWFTRLWGIDTPDVDRDMRRYVAMMSRYGLIGGMSNDLFGYDKDMAEQVATGVDVLRRQQSSDNPGMIHEQATMHAFHRLISIHNKELDDLVRRCRGCEDLTEGAVLLASLTTIWATRVLHHEFMGIYDARTLRKALGEHRP